jgi:hypothetical protein
VPVTRGSKPIFVVPGGEKDPGWAGVVVKEYDRDRDGSSTARSRLDKAIFDRLDRDRDGMLTAAELVGWFRSPPTWRSSWRWAGCPHGRHALLVRPPGVTLERSRPGWRCCRWATPGST